MIQFELDEITVRDIELRLGMMRAKAPQVMKNALNATARDARKDLWAKANETYTVKKGGFNKDTRIKPASIGTLEAILLTRGSPIEMIKFSVRNRKGTPSVEIVRGQVKSMGKRSFVNNIAFNGYHLGVAKYTGKSSGKGQGGYRPNRLGIEKKFSVSSPVMIGNERRVYGVVEPTIQDNLRRNVETHIAKILG